jgi:hypothetical protein
MTDANRADDLLKLTELCPPPADPGPSHSERGVRTPRQIPESHYDLVRTYGTGCFDDFLWIFAMGADNANLDIESSTGVMQSILRAKGAPDLREVLARYGVKPQDMIQWGSTDNGDSLLWIPAGEPENWPTIVIQAGQLAFVSSPRSSTGVVLDILTGELNIGFFPDDFPSDHPEFSTNPYV